jgi:hypothetical protein
MQYHGLFKQENPFLGMVVALCTLLQISILAGLLSIVNCPILRTHLLNTAPTLPLPANIGNTIHTDDINMPESSSVVHSYVLYICLLTY